MKLPGITLAFVLSVEEISAIVKSFKY
jgi:hypothetical protein